MIVGVYILTDYAILTIFYYIQKQMKPRTISKESTYRKTSYRQAPKSSYYNPKDQQKPSYNFIEQSKLRIVQDNLVSVSGLSSHYNNLELLCSGQCFGKYGSVNKVIITSQGKHRQAAIQVYITFDNEADAAFTIRAMDGIKIEGKQITSTFGTTKYCTYFLKQNKCTNDKCIYLHEYDTKNQLLDGVKNNLDFLDEKAQKILKKNLRYYIENEYQEKQHKIDVNAEFPSISETIQYLIQQKVFKAQEVQKLRKQVAQEKELLKLKQNVQKQGPKSRSDNKVDQIKEPSEQQNDTDKFSNKSNAQSSVKSQLLNDQPSQVQIQKKNQMSEEVINVKNRKCNSLSTAPSPTKYQKEQQQNIKQNSNVTQLDISSIEKSIERRIIKEIMKNRLIFKSKMDFVTNISTKTKQENNKIKNYVRKHLLNEI